MAADKSKSLIMAQRLKDLRTERGLSHESLKKALMEKYEIDISIDSLKNYEVSKAQHAKAYKNEGMRVEYLRCLADFYGVSADYILGADVPKSSNTTIQDMVACLGISEESLLTLYAWNNMEEILHNEENEHLAPVSDAVTKARKMNNPVQKGKQIVDIVDRLISAISYNPPLFCQDFAAFIRGVFQYEKFRQERDIDYMNGKYVNWHPEDNTINELSGHGFAVIPKGDAARWYLSRFCDHLESVMYRCVQKEARNELNSND